MKLKKYFGVALACVFLGLTITGDVARADSASDSELSSVARHAFDQVSECMSAEGSKLDVLYLLDSSSSLQDTDPNGLRADIVAQSIQQLGFISQNREVNVAISTFDLTYVARLPWSTVTPESSLALARNAQKAVRGWDGGGGTNWEQALSGAQKTMASAPESRTACKVVVWLTDGGINVTGSGEDLTANIEAMDRICGVDPVSLAPAGTGSTIDELRTSKVHVLGVLLRNDKFLDSESSLNRERDLSLLSYMKPIVEGSGTVNDFGFTLQEPGRDHNYPCGQSPLPADAASGAFIVGKDPISLAFEFGSLANRMLSGSPLEVSSTSPHSFTIDPGINGFDIQIAAADWSLSGSDGKVSVSSAAKGSASDITTSEAGVLTTIRVRGAAVKPGIWSLEQSAGPTPGVFVYSLLTLKGSTDGIYAGRKNHILVKALGPAGQPARLEDYATVAFTALAVGRDGSKADIPCTAGSQSAEFTCDFSPNAVGDYRFVGALKLTTKSGEALAPVPLSLSLSVEPIPEFPKVTPTTVQLSPLDGRRGSAQGTIHVVGPARGDGEVCFPSAADVEINQDPLPERRSSYSFSGLPWGECIAVPTGAVKDVVLVVSNDQAASGIVSGTIAVSLKSKTSGEVLAQSVAFEFESVRQASPPWWLVGGLLLLGILLPLVFLYVRAFTAARLSLKGLQSAVIPVRLSFMDSTVSLARVNGISGDGGLFALDDWKYLSTSVGRPKTFDAGAGVVVRAQSPRVPINPIEARALAPEGYRIISSAGSVPSGRFANVGLRPVGQWVIVAAESGIGSDQEVVDATLIAFVDPSSGALAEQGLAISTSACSPEAEEPWLRMRSGLTHTNESTRSRSSGRSEAAKARKSSKPSGRPSQGSEDFADSTAHSSRSPFDDLGSGTAHSGNPFDAVLPPPGAGPATTDPFGGLGGTSGPLGSGAKPASDSGHPGQISPTDDPFAGA
jgi:hypothetical protein